MTRTAPAIRLRHLTAAGLIGLLQACASTPEPVDDGSDYLAAERARVAGLPQAILGDACVVRDVSGSGDHVLRQQSLNISDAALGSLRQRLQDKGIAVPQAALPTACAGIGRVGEPPRVAPTWEADASELDTRYLTTSDSVNEGTAGLNHRLLGAVGQAIKTADGDYKRRKLNLTDDDLAAARDWAGADTLWLLRIEGIDVSATKVFFAGGNTNDQDCGDRRLDARQRLRCEQRQEDALRNSDRFSYTLALVDLGSGELVWYNNTRNVPGRPYEPSNFGSVWAQRALSPFYE